jgi:8-amino-7-oxononanoate synthase
MSGVARGWAEEDLAGLSARGLLRSLEALASPQGAVVRLGTEVLVNFSSNDYLGLATHPSVVAAAREALLYWGMGSGASRLVVGDTLAHRALETRLAAFEDAEAVLLFNSGYSANLGLLPALVGADDAVFSDALNHASLVDGCRLSRARVLVYPHADAAALAGLLQRTAARRKLVVTDSVFSMDGDVAPLAEVVEVCRQEGAALLVDEAHATGVLGLRGAGLCEELGLTRAVDVRMCTLGKALGGFGAYAATSAEVAALLVNRARSFVFSTALPAAACAAAGAALDVLEQDSSLRQRLWRNIHAFHEGLRALGHPSRPASAIFPLVLGSAERALAAAAFLRERGLLVKAIRPPTVPAGTSRLRFALSAAHSSAHLQQALVGLQELKAHGLLVAA